MSDKGVVIVTGSSRGIGAATARRLHKDGYQVVVHGRTDDESLNKIAEELDAFKIACDAGSREAIYAEIAKVKQEYGEIVGLVNNAGMVASRPFLEMEDEDWLEQYRVNVMGVGYFTQACVEMFGEKGGSVVNLSSIRGMYEMASPRVLVYSMTKAAVSSMTVSLARELGPKIRVNAVAPGGTETDIAKGFSKELRQKYEQEPLVEHMASPEEIANVIAFLISDDSSYVNGQTIIADGGYQFRDK